ncbi:MAG: hypothetical protein IPG06_24340 [Haliea sp.]|nr:hypothetical protein [Haliea sp.]
MGWIQAGLLPAFAFTPFAKYTTTCFGRSGTFLAAFLKKLSVNAFVQYRPSSFEFLL